MAKYKVEKVIRNFQNMYNMPKSYTDQLRSGEDIVLFKFEGGYWGFAFARGDYIPSPGKEIDVNWDPPRESDINIPFTVAQAKKHLAKYPDQEWILPFLDFVGKSLKCECGGDKLGIPHSTWCDKYV